MGTSLKWEPAFNLETYKDLSKTPSNTTLEKSKTTPTKKATPEKGITAIHIVTNQSKQQSIFNKKIETEQTRLTEELSQLQILVQSLKHNMKDDDIKQKFKMLITKDVATLKESLLETFESKQLCWKQLQKEIDTLKKYNSELRVYIKNIRFSKQQKDISNNQDKQSNEIQVSLKSLTEVQRLLRSFVKDMESTLEENIKNLDNNVKFRSSPPEVFFFLLCNLIEITLRHGCSLVNLLHILRTLFGTASEDWKKILNNQ